jgi:hypothetical protein
MSRRNHKGHAAYGTAATAGQPSVNGEPVAPAGSNAAFTGTQQVVVPAATAPVITNAVVAEIDLEACKGVPNEKTPLGPKASSNWQMFKLSLHDTMTTGWAKAITSTFGLATMGGCGYEATQAGLAYQANGDLESSVRLIVLLLATIGSSGIVFAPCSQLWPQKQASEGTAAPAAQATAP